MIRFNRKQYFRIELGFARLCSVFDLVSIKQYSINDDYFQIDFVEFFIRSVLLIRNAGSNFLWPRQRCWSSFEMIGVGVGGFIVSVTRRLVTAQCTAIYLLVCGYLWFYSHWNHFNLRSTTYWLTILNDRIVHNQLAFCYVEKLW